MTTLDQPTAAGLGGGVGEGMATRRMAVTAQRPAPLSRVWRTGMLAAVLAAAANILVYVLARAFGVTFMMPLQLISGAQPVVLPVEMVILGSVGGAIAGTVAFAVLDRFAPRYPRLFVIIGLAFLLVSLATPLSLESTDGATKATLMLMHVVAGGATIGLLSGRGRR